MIIETSIDNFSQAKFIKPLNLTALCGKSYHYEYYL